MSQVPVQVGPYRPVTIYDAPQVLFTQLLDGELGLDSAAKTFTRPDQLTPSERDTVSERLSRAAGNSRVVKALADVALNPWTWFYFLTSPLGEKPIADLFKLAKGYSPYVVTKYPILAQMGLLTSQQAVRGTRMEAVVGRHAAGIEEVYRGPAVQKAATRIGEVVSKLGLESHSFDWRRYSPGTPEEAIAKEVQYALHGAMDNVNKDVVYKQTARASSEARKAAPTKQYVTADVARAAWTPTDPLTVLAKHGAEDLPDLIRAAQAELAGKLYGSPEAVIKMHHGARRLGNKSRDLRDALGEAHSAVKGGKGSLQDFLDNVQEHVINPVMQGGSTYTPRNMSTTFLNGKEVADDAGDAMFSSLLRTGSSAQLRGPKAPMYYHGDLEAMKEVLGATPALEAEIVRSKKAFEDSMKGQPKRFLRIDPEGSFNRYVKSGAMTYSTFIQDVGDGVRAASAGIARGMVDPVTGESLIKVRMPLSASARRHRVQLGGKLKNAAPLAMDIGAAEKAGMAPTGGFSLADVLYSDWGTVQNPWARETIAKIIAPRMMGRVSDNHSLLQSTVISAKEMVGRFLGTDAAAAIEKSSPFGAKFVTRMKQYSRPETAFSSAKDLERAAIKTLYSSGLGLNVPSAIINATQPFILAGNVLGLDNLARGYGQAFKELGDYVALRARAGWNPITTAERAALLKKTHRFADHNGVDLLEVAGDTLATLEGNILKSITGEHTRHTAADRIFFDIPMTLFRNTEVLNRNVVAHATHFRDEAMAAKGALFEQGVRENNIRGMVRETQFGSHWMNMSQGFMPEIKGFKKSPPWGDLLSNPLIRQYMTFPARTLGTWAHTVPRMLGQEPGEAWKSYLTQGTRAMALSAVGIDVAQDLFGADISRAGFVANITDLVPGFSQGQFDPREGPIPVPPVIDIGYSLLKSGFTADYELFKRTLPRMVPMGAALSRAFKSMPDMGLVGLGQTQYADWTNIVDGKVPVYKDDGTLIEMRNPSELIFKGLGVDMGSFQDESKFMGYLVQQRDQATETRRRYMQALVGGDADGAEQVANEYQRRWKLPLTVTKGQIRRFMDNRERPRVDRQLDSLGDQLRSQYEGMAPAGVGAGRAHPGYPDYQADVNLPPAVIQMIRDEVARRKVPDPRQADQTTEEPWGPFNLPGER